MNSTSWGLFALLLSAPLAHASDDIVGGELVDPSDVIARTTVILTDGNSLCSASIIDTDLLVTAAHCVTNVGQLSVGFTTDMDQAGSDAFQPVVDFTVTDEWAQSQGQGSGRDVGDIAVVLFSGGLPDGYQAAKLLPGTQALVDGESVVLAGFGITAANTQDGVGQLRKASVPILDAAFGQTEVELDQTQGHGACHGDSGGPAFVTSGADQLLWGVTNRGFPNNAPDDCLHDVIYTRIAPYASWIQTQAATMRAAAAQQQ